MFQITTVVDDGGGVEYELTGGAARRIAIPAAIRTLPAAGPMGPVAGIVAQSAIPARMTTPPATTGSTQPGSPPPPRPPLGVGQGKGLLGGPIGTGLGPNRGLLEGSGLGTF